MSTVIRARPAPGRSIDTDTFTDITPANVAVNWGGDGILVIEFDLDLDDATRRAVRCRIIADNPVEEDLMATLADLAGQTPTTVADRILRLERAVMTLARLVLRDDA